MKKIFAIQTTILPACGVALSVVVTPPELLEQIEPPSTHSISSSETKFESERMSIWENRVGEGFRPTTQSFDLSAGATYGIAEFGSREDHDLALVSLSYGRMLGQVRGEDHWYRGNLEFRLELFTGAQFSPGSEWLVGLRVRHEPSLSAACATGSRPEFSQTSNLMTKEGTKPFDANAFLASDRASAITGSEYVIDRGTIPTV